MPAFVRPPDPADPEAFRRLVAAWSGYCERWADRMGRSHPGRDFGPPANLALWRAASAFEPGRGTRFLTLLRWELRSARTLTLRRRAVPTAPLLGEPAVPPRLPDDEPDFEGRIAGLPPLLREVIRLRFVAGLTHAEIGERVGRSRPSAHRLEVAALVALRRASDR